jgi:hypothetical protein
MDNLDGKEILAMVNKLKQENPAFLKICQIILDYLKEIVDLGLKKKTTDEENSQMDMAFKNFDKEEPPFSEEEEIIFVDINPLNQAILDVLEESRLKMTFTDEDVPEENNDDYY